MSQLQTHNTGQSHPTGKSLLCLGVLFAGYIGVYLCRKNLTVAVPLLEEEWGLSKERLGLIASFSTLAYAAGKFLFGPLTDRIGGRNSLLASMALVAIFGACGALAPSLWVLIATYSLSRLFGAASWGGMMKLVPEWFTGRHVAFACGILSLSFVCGGALATAFAGFTATLTNDSWRAVLGLPSLVLLLLLGICWAVLPPGTSIARSSSGPHTGYRSQLQSLFLDRRFLVLLCLSFTLTLVRETFNFWTVDFIRTEGGPGLSSATAALVSTPFDLCGAAGILSVGWVFGRLDQGARQALLAIIMVLLTVLLLGLPLVFDKGLWVLATGVGCMGFLVYGPYSLLGGVLSVEVGGKQQAATVSGLVDGTGYVAGFISGVVFGHLLSAGGYRLGFGFMAALTALSAVLSLFLYPRAETQATEPAASAQAIPTPQ